MLSEGADGGDRRRQMATLGQASGQLVRKGQVVRSVRGRDKGRWYLVVSTAGDGFIMVADGARRPVSRPKRKNPKHLLVYDAVAEGVAKSFTAGRRVNDNDVQSALQSITNSFNEDGEEVDDTGQARCD